MGKERIKCPYCSEPILPDAKKCRFCGEWLREENRPVIDDGLAVPQPSEGVQESQDEVEKEPYEDEELFETPGEKVKAEPPKKKRRIAWLRIILAIVYLGVIVGLAIYERSAHEILHSGKKLESNEKCQAAFEKYKQVIERFSFSFAVIEAREGLRRLKEREELDLPELPDSKYSAYNVYWLPFVAWPICAVLLFLVFVTRIHRLGIVCLAFLLLVLAVCGSLLQLVWYGLISFEPVVKIVQELMAKPVAVFIASYALLFVTAIMTLTAPRKVSLSHRFVSG